MTSLIFLLQAAQPGGTPEEINFGALFLRMILFLGIVVLLIVLILKRVLPLLVPGARVRTKSIQVLERFPIDPRKSLLVVEIQERIYLMGAAEGQINILMELDREKIPVPEAPPARAVSFSDVLKKTLSRNK